jgi:hypothetical protein
MKDQTLREVMLQEYGPLMGGEDLRRALGYRTWSAFARAVRAEALLVKVFEIPGRRGRFALTQEVAEWLVQLRDQKTDRSEAKKEETL